MAKNKIDVSIIIPIYNAEPFLRECLSSVLAQRYSNYEVIMVNDDSTDGSRMIMEEYAGLNDRFICIDQDNQGAGGARNTGIDASNGKYVLFLDADDILAKHTLSDLMPVALSNDLDMINVDWNYIPYDPFFPSQVPDTHQNKILKKKDFFQYYVNNINITRLTLMCTLFKTQIIKANNVRFKTKFAEDILFNMQALLCCRRFYFTQKEYYFYRKSASGLTANFFDNRELIYERNKASIEMLKLSEAATPGVLSPLQKKNLQREILKHAGIRYLMLQNMLFTEKKIADHFKHDTKIAFWGAGKITRNYLTTIQNTRLMNAVLVDNDRQKQGGAIWGYPVISPADMSDTYYAGYQHLIASYFIFEIFAQMKNLGLVKSFMDLRLDIGANEQYDMQLNAMDDLFTKISEIGIEINYPGKTIR